MKVLVTIPWGAHLGGAERILWNFLQHVEGSEATFVLVFLQQGPWVEEATEHGFTTEVIPSGRLRHTRRFIGTVRALIRLIEREQPDVQLDWSAKTHLYGGVAAALTGTTARTLWWQQSVSDGGWLDRLATKVPSAAIGCYSRAAASAQRRLRPERPCIVVNPGTDDPTPLLTHDVRERLGISRERFVVGCVARLHPEKRQDLLLDAVAELRRRGIDAHALIVGGAILGFGVAYEQTLRERIAELGLRDAATLTGHVTDVPNYIHSMDVLVSTGARESFGMSLIEAMALARPVVAFAASGGPDEILEHGRSGLLVPRQGFEGLANTLERLARDPDHAARIAAAGRAEFERRYRSEEAARSFVAALKGIARGAA